MMSTSTDGARPNPLRGLPDQILRAGAEVSSPAGLLDFIGEVSTLADAIEGGLANAAWRGHLSEAASVDDRPPMPQVQELLRRGGLDREGASPGHAAFGQTVLSAMRAARTLHDAASAARAAGITEDVRVRVEKAQARRDADDAAYFKDTMDAIARVLAETVPDEAQERTTLALQRELAAVRRRQGDGQNSADGR
ncbi:hypothetical protein [Actinacidiphila acididurans]|uniref:DUF222 domain-containing protein n=1 Tax=Actinacidiphila acididurans TaxID=2784346 RepID=A0ABS2TL95_9ACTN|nr:hypothetical protein [Actinacidiphila acididurans]MBM9504104.1 hypothetical protein [Actinacidiphila acididurans]